MNILDSSNQLLENSHGRFLMKPLVLYDVVKEFPVLAVLHDQIKFGVCLDDLHEKARNY